MFYGLVSLKLTFYTLRSYRFRFTNWRWCLLVEIPSVESTYCCLWLFIQIIDLNIHQLCTWLITTMRRFERLLLIERSIIEYTNLCLLRWNCLLLALYHSHLVSERWYTWNPLSDWAISSIIETEIFSDTVRYDTPSLDCAHKSKKLQAFIIAICNLISHFFNVLLLSAYYGWKFCYEFISQ